MVLGPNGAGKTTLVRILATLLTPDAGRVEVFGHDVVREPAAVRELIGLTGQFAAVDEILTGRENLEMFGRLFKLSREEARRRAGELLERFDLAQAADRPARTYSGGMRRRLDIASSLLTRLPVWLPVSLAPLTFNEHERRPETRHCSRPEWPTGSDRGQRARPAILTTGPATTVSLDKPRRQPGLPRRGFGTREVT